MQCGPGNTIQSQLLETRNGSGNGDDKPLASMGGDKLAAECGESMQNFTMVYLVPTRNYLSKAPSNCASAESKEEHDWLDLHAVAWIVFEGVDSRGGAILRRRCENGRFR